MSQEQHHALQVAKKRYQKGTAFKSETERGRYVKASNPDMFFIEEHPQFFRIVDKGSRGVIYDSKTNTWARIAERPLQQKLVEDYGFEKRTFPHGEFTTNRYEKDGLSVDFDYLGEDLVNVDVLVKETFANNPDNLEAFIKSYLELLKHQNDNQRTNRKPA